MNKLFLFLLLLISTAFLYGQVENAEKFRPVAPGFYQEFLNFSTPREDMTRLDAFIQVPYSFMQFVKVPGGFGAAYTITITVFDKDKNKVVVEKSWTEKVETPDFDVTNSSTSFNLSLRSFTLQPDDYLIRSAVEDNESKNEFTLETPFTVRNLSTKPALSDIMLIAKMNVVEGSNKIVPNVSKNVNAQKDGIPVFFEIESREKRDLEIKYKVADAEDNILGEEKEQRSIDSGKTQIFHTIKVNDLSLGSYIISVQLLGRGNTEITTVKKPFYSKWAGVPSNVEDLDKAIDQLRYIAKPSEIDHIEDAETQNEKIQRYMAFWKSKDPAPGTEENEVFNEYYRRIEYSNQKFSHYTEGWKTDRGMVFITLGTPSNVERHPFDYDSKPYEVWEYYDLNRSFVFVDETGFGDYRLITPMHGDDYRYR